ncbi:glycosyltransferase family 4 protein [Halieaceae bacterium IMCC14734]|uniref:Glycosyltransferase family 4 protein n=1 Tax=Candidatus Litorirhabdus singularis TaxID=2518993 RepID=A0ABT3TG96_9GAMM|nr:glycosyltransferase family 4 protein [Candidatus Litorirhabdus singularis]MCX2981294.1 glycosyltransferase family 4 protein [Candidatus Litorirhabdus singularis]
MSQADANVSLLVISSLYPNPAQERHGIFVETRLRHLCEAKPVSARVIAPVPWVPPLLGGMARYQQYVGIPAYEERHGIPVHHPRYLVIPYIGMLLTPFFMFLSLLMAVNRLKRENIEFDLIDAHYYYPDGVAVALLATILKRTFTVTARGTDINLIPEVALPKKMILWAAGRAAASITVCSALRDRMVEIGADGRKVHVMRNGVDLELFRPLEREQCRSELLVSGNTLISVGHLIDRKGHDLVIAALLDLPDYSLVIAGDGEELGTLQQLVAQHCLTERVRFLGAVTQPELCRWLNAADALVLASSREGWANVLLESMACGTPVVATSIWGTPEVVAAEEAGVLVETRTASGISKGVQKLFADYPQHSKTRAYAELFSWDATVNSLYSLFHSLTACKAQA